MRRIVLVGLALFLLAACSSALVDHDGRQDETAKQNLCFGGKPEVFWDGANSTVMTNPSGRRFMAVEGRVMWQWGRDIQQVDLRTGRWGFVDSNAILKAADRWETFVWSWGHDPTSGGSQLVAIGLKDQGKPERILVEEQESHGSPRASRIVLDGDFIYFIGSSFARTPDLRDGLFRVPRYGTGLPERLAALPSGDETPFVIDRNYVYWSQVGALWRRQINPIATMQQLTVTKGSRLPIVVGDGRLYYLDGKSLFSVQVDGSAPPTEHLKGLDVDRDSTMLVDRDCLYWNTKSTIMRAKLDGPTNPDVIADKATYDGSPMDSDGKHLYWIDEARSRVMRVGRSAFHLR